MSAKNTGKRSKGKSLAAKSVKNCKWQVSDVVDAQFNATYCGVEFKTLAKRAWNSDKIDDISLPESVAIHKTPFNCCHLPNFLENTQFLEQLKNELLLLEFCEKSNDLYKFQQSEDLKSVKSAAVTALKTLIYNDVRKWAVEVINFIHFIF